MRKILWLLPLLAAPLWGQISNPGVVAVPSTPSTCSTLPLKVVTGTPNVYGTNGSGGCTQVGSGAALPIPHLGLIGTRGEQLNSTSGASTWVSGLEYFIARENIPPNGVKLLFQNLYVSLFNVETSIGSGTYKVAIQYPVLSGPIYPCYFSGNPTITVAGLADALTDWCTNAVTIPAGALVGYRVLYTNPSGIIYNQGNSTHYSTTYESFIYGTGTPTDNVYSGTFTPGSNPGFAFTATAIVGYTQSPSVCNVGDSRVFGQNESVTDLSGDVGEDARAIGPAFAYSKFDQSGTLASQAVSNMSNRLRAIRYCTHVIDEYGINDIESGTTPTTLAGYRTTLASLWPWAVTIGTTLPPVTSSTDSWATIANQTTMSNVANLVTFNGLVRAGISGEASFWDPDYAMDPTTINKWPVSQNLFATAGTANYATTDGTHETPAMNSVIAHSGYEQTNIIFVKGIY